MLISDEADIGYRLLLLWSSLFSGTMAVMSIIGFFFTPKPGCKTAKYQAFGFLLYSFDLILIEITYIVPSSMVLFNTHETTCKALGMIQYLGETLASFYIIGITVNILLGVLPGKVKGECTTKYNTGKTIFIAWTVVGTSYCLIFIVVSVTESIIDVRGSRCWLKHELGNMTVFVYQFISYRGVAIGAALLSFVCSIVCQVYLKRLAKEHKQVFKTNIACDTREFENVQTGLAALNRSLLRRFVILMITSLLQSGVSILFDIMTREKILNDSNYKYFGWFDMLYILAFLISGLVFTQPFINCLIEKIVSAYTSSQEEKPLSYSEFVAV